MAKAATKSVKSVKASKAPEECGKCGHSLRMIKFKNDETAKITCPDCGWRPGDKIKKSKFEKDAPVATKATKASPVKATASKAVKPTKAAPKVAPAHKAKSGAFENPYREGGNYHACVNGLLALGQNRMHSFANIIAAVRKEMFSNWKAFASKEKRNEETGLDANAKVIQNVSVLKRPDYGAKIIEQGYEVRFSGKEKTAGLFKIGK
jgi:DNA-directed RNA polymerase subunit RPC12/RpoP